MKNPDRVALLAIAIVGVCFMVIGFVGAKHTQRKSYIRPIVSDSTNNVSWQYHVMIQSNVFDVGFRNDGVVVWRKP